MLHQWVLFVSVVIVVLSYCENQVQAHFKRRGFPPQWYPPFGFPPNRYPFYGPAKGFRRNPYPGWVLAANPNAHENDADEAVKSRSAVGIGSQWVLAANPNAHENDDDQAVKSRSAEHAGYDDALQVVHYGDQVEELQDLGLEPSALIGFYNEDGTIGEWSLGEEPGASGAEEIVGRKHHKLDCDDVFGKHSKKKRKFCRKMAAYNEDHGYDHHDYDHHGSYGHAGHKYHKHHKHHGSYDRYRRQLPYLSNLPVEPLSGIPVPTRRPIPTQAAYRRYKRQLPYLGNTQLPSLGQLPGTPPVEQSVPLSGTLQVLPVQQITQINRPRLVRNSSLKAPVKRQLFGNQSPIISPISYGSSPEERRKARQKYFNDLRNSRAGFFENVGKAFQGMRPRSLTTTTTPPPFPVIAAIRRNFESTMNNLNSRLAYRDPMVGSPTSAPEPVQAGPVVAPAPPEPCTCDKCTPVRRTGQRAQRRNRPSPRQRPRARGRNSDPRASSASSLAAEIKQAAPSNPTVGAPAPAPAAPASGIYPREITQSFLNAVNRFISTPAGGVPDMVGSSGGQQQPVDPARTISKTIARVIDYMYPDQAPPPPPSPPQSAGSELVGSAGPHVSVPKQSDMQFVQGMQRMLNTYQKELVGGKKSTCSSQAYCR